MIFPVGRKANQFRDLWSVFNHLCVNVSSRVPLAEPPPALSRLCCRKRAGARGPAGARSGGAEPDPPAGRRGAGGRERVAGLGRCVLTRPSPPGRPSLESHVAEEQSAWSVRVEAPSAKDVTTAVFQL